MGADRGHRLPLDAVRADPGNTAHRLGLYLRGRLRRGVLRADRNPGPGPERRESRGPVRGRARVPGPGTSGGNRRACRSRPAPPLPAARRRAQEDAAILEVAPHAALLLLFVLTVSAAKASEGEPRCYTGDAASGELAFS